MNKTRLLLFATLSMAASPAPGDTTHCPLDLPYELYRDCRTAELAANTDESGPTHFGESVYDLSANLQAWVDRQMRAEFEREGEAAPEGSDVARQTDRP
jgi:hypothetical protein